MRPSSSLLAASLCALALSTQARAQAPQDTPQPTLTPEDKQPPPPPAESPPPAAVPPIDGELHGNEFIEIEDTAPIDAASARASVTAADIQRSNVVNAEDALKYLPSIHVRKRYVGDPNGVLQIRGISTWQTARTDVVADGMPLSYHLETRYSGAPRWALVSPEEIDRIDVVYGPYSAAQSGHGMAGSVEITTRLPEKREVVAHVATFAQAYKQYGTDDLYVGSQVHTSYGDRAGNLRYFVSYTHLANEGQPQNFGTVSGPFDAATTEPTVSGAYRDSDPRGLDRVVYGNRGTESIEHHLAKLKLAYDITPRIRALSTVAFLDREIARSEGRNYLRDRSGATLWSCPCSIDGQAFDMRAGDFAASSRRQSDVLAALRLGADLSSGWRFEANGSYYQVLRDQERAQDRSSEDPAFSGSGVVTKYDDTRWGTLNVKLAGDQFLHDSVSVESGYQLANYGLAIRQYTSNDVAIGVIDDFSNASGGKTDLHAVYAQVRWRRGRFDVTPGLRQELWRTYGGFYDDTRMTDTDHAERRLWRTSPKLVGGYEPVKGTRIQAAAALAYRFPIVEELFRNEYSQVSTSLADATLQPERGFHKAVSVVQQLADGSAALHLYEDDVRDVIFSQRDMDTRVTSFLNMDRVRTRGVEATLTERGMFYLPRLDLQLSVAVQAATILENKRNPEVEGNRFPRVPRLRASAHGSYRLTDHWDVSLGARYSSKQYDRLENDDTASGFGAIDAFFMMDARTSYRFDGPGLALSVGVDNILNHQYFVFHPYPQRMFYSDLRWSY
jgi:iron complex outermembrane recepter protein